MKILIVSQYFWPEEFRINDLAVDLVKRGHVVVLTGKPNYPKGKIYEGYGFLSHTKDSYHGVEIFRVPLIPRGSGSGLRLAINYVSFILAASLFVLCHRKKYDVSFTFAISPITQAYPALLHKRIFKSKACVWVQDLWPESVTAAGKMSSNNVMKCLDRMVRNIYDRTDKVLVQSEAFIQSIHEKGVMDSKIKYMPNWAEDLYCDNSNVVNEKYQHLIPTGFRIMFAGNIGEAQDFESIVKAAELTKQYPEIKWVIVGDGRKKSWAEREVAQLGLQNNVVFLGRFSVEDMPNFFCHADLMLVTLKDEDIFSMTIPGKVQSYMAFGKPIVGMLNGIGAKVIQEADCGYISNAGDYISLAQNVIDSYLAKSDILNKKGNNGKLYYNQYFSKEVIIDNLLDTFQELIQ